MAVYATPAGRIIHGWLVCLLAASALCGCNRQEGGAKVEPGAPVVGETLPVVAPASSDRMNQPFAEATLRDMPDQYLPDITLAGKSVGKLYEAVAGRWDKIAFAKNKAERQPYYAAVATELGTIEIELLPDLAPNHVRNFIALAQCGYYDGLVFERTIRDQSENDPSTRVEFIEGGCPTGTGNSGFGSIGYWLKPEFNKDVPHVEGTVGACRGEEPDSAACRFYITLSKTPVMDGERTIFGKVTNGLDVVRRISTQPVINSPEYPVGDRPEKPIVIRKVTIKNSPGEPSPAVQQVKHEEPKPKPKAPKPK